jgi:hypothetical protein
MSARKCPNHWLSLSSGRCTADVLPSGQHQCTLVDTGIGTESEVVHAACSCACGATAMRHAWQRQAVVDISAGGVGSILVGGMELNTLVTSGTVEFRGMQPTKLTLGMEHVQVAASGEAVLDDLTHNALLQLGWVPPETDARHREELRTALRCEYEDWRWLTELAGELRRDVDLEYGS